MICTKLNRRCQRVVVLILALLLMAGCASGSGEDTTPAATDNAPAQSTAPDEPDTTRADTNEDNTDEPVASEAYISPIGEALGLDLEAQTVAFDDYVREAEELVRECMTEAGFDYAPVTSGIDPVSRRQSELYASLSAEQFANQYGFGIATLFELNFKGEGVVAFVNQQFGPPPTEQRSPSEQDAYEIALNGESTQGLSAEEAQEQLFGGNVGASREGSCRSYGYSTAENPGAIVNDLFSILGDELDALSDQLDADPRIQEANAAWQTCMAARGYAYESQDEILAELNERADELANQFLLSPQILQALGQAQQQDFAAMDAESRQLFLEEVGALQGFAWVPEIQVEVDNLIEFELRVAADSFDCTNQEVLNEVLAELETAFVEAHRDQLALIAAGDA